MKMMYSLVNKTLITYNLKKKKQEQGLNSKHIFSDLFMVKGS